MDMSGSIEHAVSSYLSQWMGQHPYFAWSIGHPVLSLGLVFIAIFLLGGLIKAIGRGVEQIWIFLLKTPFKLLQPMFRPIWGSIWRRVGHTEDSGSSRSLKPPGGELSQRSEQIIDRLHALNQEQQSLLTELATLANPTPHRSENQSRSDTQYNK
jgi:hypothetical protein